LPGRIELGSDTYRPRSVHVHGPRRHGKLIHVFGNDPVPCDHYPIDDDKRQFDERRAGCVPGCYGSDRDGCRSDIGTKPGRFLDNDLGSIAFDYISMDTSRFGEIVLKPQRLAWSHHAKLEVRITSGHDHIAIIGTGPAQPRHRP